MNDPLIDYSLLEQGSEEWIEARIGMVTASRAADVIATLKRGGEAAARASYRSELLCEILTGQPYPQYVSQDMEWGRLQEPFARAAYELEQDVLVETCGLIVHPEVERFGASPDGRVGEDGLIQIKCPTTRTHLDWMLGGVVPVEHIPQMLAEMSCTGRKWCDFVSYEPRLPSHLQLFIRRYMRDDKFLATLESEVKHFVRELDSVLAALPQGQPQGVVLVMDRVTNDEMEF
jgi:hypothetical protein